MALTVVRVVLALALYVVGAVVLGVALTPAALLCIGRGAIIGLNAIVLPGVEVGDRAVVGAGVFVPKDTKIEPGTVYLGKS